MTKSRTRLPLLALTLTITVAGALPASARAEDAPHPLALAASYIADTVVVADGPQRATRYVDLLRIEATADLDQAVG